MKQLMSGNEAIARGVYEAGIKIASAYPGTPSTEVLENLPQYREDIYSEWAPNEKVALEVAYGAAIAGTRSICTMKMVGLNVAADPLFTAANMGTNAAFIVVTADDPSLHSSQNEQDNRYYARAAKIPMVEPSDSQECKDFVKTACEISERFDTPVLFRTTTRINHSKGIVSLGERTEVDAVPYKKQASKYVAAPANAYRRRPVVEKRVKDLVEYGAECPLNKVELKGSKVGVIAAGVGYQYAKEVFPDDTSFLKLGLTYPLPEKLIREFAEKVEELYVIEELEPFMEEQIRAMGIACKGKELTGNMYELNTQLLRERVFGKKPVTVPVPVKAVSRPPALCPGCPHRGFFYTLGKVKNAVVTGDIGCYTLGAAPPRATIDTVLCMGAGFSVGMGMSKAFAREGQEEKIVFGVMGDSTFCHSGMTGAMEILYNRGKVIPVILDNRITGMTGQQDNPSSGYTLLGEVSDSVRIEAVMESFGYRAVVVDPQDLTATDRAVKEAVDDLKAGRYTCIIARRPCVLLKRAKVEKKLCAVDPEKCRSCKKCLKVGCPALSVQDGKAFIDSSQCIGCTVCAQVCPFGAIS